MPDQKTATFSGPTDGHFHPLGRAPRASPQDHRGVRRTRAVSAAVHARYRRGRARPGTKRPSDRHGRHLRAGGPGPGSRTIVRARSRATCRQVGDDQGCLEGPEVIAAIYTHVTPRKERERLAKYLK
jgi:hypothetical protein